MLIITGGAGFIGSNLLATLSETTTEELIVCDVFGAHQKWRNLVNHRVAHLVSPSELSTFIKDNCQTIKGLFHLGAISSTTERDVDLILTQNYHFSIDLWSLCTTYGIPFIYASSAATYGNGEHGFYDHFDAAYLQKLKPLNPYGWSKHLFDKWVQQALAKGKEAPPQWAGLKFFNVYGPNEQHKEGQKSVIATLVPLIKNQGHAALFKSYHPNFADGGQQRDFIWVQDCVDVMLWLWNTPQVSGLFNVGTGTARSFNDLATAVFTALGAPSRITYIDMPEQLKETYQYWTQAEMGKLSAAGYPKPFTSLEEGVRLYVQNYLTQPDPYR